MDAAGGIKLDDLTGGVAVITAGAAGIGLAFANRCIANGNPVVLADIEAPALASAEKELTALGGDVLGVLCDVTKPEQVEAVAAAVEERHPGKDISFLFCNAGLSVLSTVLTASLQDWRFQFDVNVFGTVHALHAFLPKMRAQKTPGAIVNTASMAGIYPMGGGPYIPAKTAVVSLTETLYQDLKAAL